MARKLDYAKDTSRRMASAREDAAGRFKNPAEVNPTLPAMRIPDAPVKSETKANKARLARIKAGQKEEEEARKKKIAAAKAERDAQMKAYAAGMKRSRGGGRPQGMGIRAAGLGPRRKLKMLQHGGKVHRGRTAVGNKD